ncbi:MAG: WG repeat-containing protein [Bacteroidota bacterium]|nr:MAG: WG repeat-containing protein [Bacteroidota bacterium]
MKKIVVFLVALMLTNIINAQDLKPFKSDKELWGYKDATGKEIIPARYNFAWSFTEGIARVRNKKMKYGFIDVTGKEVIPIKYEDAKDFYEGLAAVKSDDKCGFIDKTGNVIIPLRYDEVGNFSEGLASARSGAVRGGKYNTLSGGKYGFIDKSGNEIIAFKYDGAGDFSEGFAYVKVGKKYHFIDKKEEELGLLDYDDVGDFSEGMAKVRIGHYFDGKWGYIDTTGKRVIDVKFEEAGDFYKGEASVKLNGKSMYIDKTGSNDEERKKIAEQEAERKKQERKALVDWAIANAIRDTLAKEVLTLYLNEDNKVFNKVTDLQKNVESTMIFSEKYGFDKRNWIIMSTEIDNKAKVAREQINTYKSMLKKYEPIREKNELIGKISTNLFRMNEFVTACELWSQYINTLGAHDNGKTELDRVADSLIDLKKSDDNLRSFIQLYKKRNSL